MPDGSNTDPRQKVQPRASGSGPVSHPLMGSTRSEPAMRNTAKHATPPINIKMTVPILGRRFYFAIAGGKERRSKERLALERKRSPLLTKSNIQFIFIGAVVLYILTLGTFLAFAAVLGP
jgi:hypothetical protein